MRTCLPSCRLYTIDVVSSASGNEHSCNSIYLTPYNSFHLGKNLGYTSQMKCFFPSQDTMNFYHSNVKIFTRVVVTVRIQFGPFINVTLLVFRSKKNFRIDFDVAYFFYLVFNHTRQGFGSGHDILLTPDKKLPVQNST